MKILIIEFKKGGHSIAHAQALEAELRRFGSVELLFPADVCDYEGIDRLCEMTKSKLVLIATLDDFFLKLLLKSRFRRSSRYPVIGIYHNTRATRRPSRAMFWAGVKTAGLLDFIIMYARPSRFLDAWLSVLQGWYMVIHPIGNCRRPALGHNGNMVFLGVASKEKGALRLPDIARQLPEGTILCIYGGAVDSEVDAKLGPWIKDGRIRWCIESFSESEKESILDKCLCVVTPYLESHGRASGVAVDAVRAGVPVLYSSDHAWTESFFKKINYQAGVRVDNWCEIDNALREVAKVREVVGMGLGVLRDADHFKIFGLIENGERPV